MTDKFDKALEKLIEKTEVYVGSRNEKYIITETLEGFSFEQLQKIIIPKLIKIAKTEQKKLSKKKIKYDSKLSEPYISESPYAGEKGKVQVEITFDILTPEQEYLELI